MKSLQQKSIELRHLDADEICKTIKQGITALRIPEEAAEERVHLMKDCKLKNAAVVLFAKKIISHFGFRW